MADGENLDRVRAMISRDLSNALDQLEECTGRERVTLAFAMFETLAQEFAQRSRFPFEDYLRAMQAMVQAPNDEAALAARVRMRQAFDRIAPAFVASARRAANDGAAA